MRKTFTSLAFCLAAIILFIQEGAAQTPPYFKGLGTGSNTIPMNNSGSHCQQLYEPTDFNMLPISGNITKVYMRNSSAGASGTYTNFSVSFLQNNLTEFPNNTFLTGFTTALSEPTITINGNATAGGWYEIPLTTPFYYDNSMTLIFEIKYDSKTGGMSGYTTSATGDKRLSIIASPGPATGNLSSLWGDFGMEVLPAGPCTDPPVPGDVVSNQNPVCPNSNFMLSLQNGTFGSGQTYQWQSSPDSTNWTDISGATNSSLTTTQAVSTYYRAQVTCGASTVNSAGLLEVSPALFSGTYTINPFLPSGSGNFQSFNEALNALKCGINGPVVFNAEPGTGPYTEQLVIPEIPGASPTNTVTFNGNQNTLQFETNTSAERSIIRLDGADYIILKKLMILANNAPTYGWGVHLTNGADYNIIDSCTIDISQVTSTTQSNSSCIVASGSNTSVTTDGEASHNTISNNTLIGAYQGIIMNASTNNVGGVGNVITRNIIKDFYANGMEFTEQDSAVISFNNINRMNRSEVTTFAGIEMGAGNQNCVINGNRIHDTHNTASSQSGTAYGIYSTGDDAPAGAPNWVINNLIYNFNSETGTQYGIYNSSSDGVNYYHNTIVLSSGSSTSGTTRGIYQLTTADSIKIKNNIIYITRGGSGTKYNLYFGATGSTIESNSNVLYNLAPAGTNGIGYFGGGFTTLVDWQGANANAFDQMSVSADPLFTNPGAGVYKPSEPSINDIGENLGVTTDILGIARSASPDPGAYEFDLAACIDPPTPGAATSSVMAACSGVDFTLDLIANSIGDNQTYQWQSSPDNTNWTNIGTLQTTTSYITSQTANTYYRAEVVCSGGTPVYSASVYVTTPALVSGVFTINNTMATGGGNFQSFSDAVNHIRCGIDGPVVFNVASGSGPYNEQVIMPEITGTSPTNTIVFNGNGSFISYLSTSSSDRATFKLDGTDYVTIDSLIITAEGSNTGDYGYGIQIMNNADHNTVRNSTININNTSSSSGFGGIIINSATATTAVGTGNSMCDSNLIINNRITGGYAGIVAVADGTTDSIMGNRIQGNMITDCYQAGIYLNGNIQAVVENNSVSRPTRSSSISTFYGTYMSTGNIGTMVSRNRFYDAFTASTSSTSVAYGVYMTASDGRPGMENVFSNNVIYNFNNSGTQYGFYNSSSDYALYYYNSVLFDNGPTTSTTYDTRGFYQTGTAEGIEYKNNIIYISRQSGGENHGIYMNTSSTSFVSDYNDIYVPTVTGMFNNFGYFGGTQYATLNDWQTGTTMDMNSYSVDPIFVAPPTNLHLQPSTPLDDKGTAVSVTVDIDNQVRDASTPDIGADELPPSVGVDMKAQLLVAPVDTTNGCYGSMEDVIVQIKNNSLSSINFASKNVTVVANINGPVTLTLTDTLKTGTLAAGDTLNVVMGTVDMSTAGTYAFDAHTEVAGDVNTANDAIPQVLITRETLSAGTISATPESYCVTGGMPELTSAGVSGTLNLQWQQSSMPGSGFADIAGANTNPYIAGSSISQTMYYRLIATCKVSADTSEVDSVVLNNPTIVSTTPGSRCGPGTVELGATGSAGSVINWYENASGGTPVYTGEDFTTPSLTADSNYYYITASTGGITTSIGAPNNGQNTGYTLEAGLFFDVDVPSVTINGVYVYPVGTGTGDVEIAVKDPSGTNMQTVTVNLTGTAAPGVKTYVPLGFSVPQGTGYSLVMLSRSGGVANLVRDGSAAITGGGYPFTVPGVMSITAGRCCPSGNSGSYYYFYDWQIATGCESDRIAVLARTNDCPMPVTLVNFTGEKQGSINKLMWTTATEVNNAGFELERSADGKNFSKLAFIASLGDNGNSNRTLDYVYYDERPLMGNGYYRLKQVDKDGRFIYSNILLIKGSKVKEIMITSLYPNPAENELNLVITSPTSEKVTLVVTDMTGKVINQTSMQVTAGDNLQKLQVSQLASGTYFIRTICANGCESQVQKFVKQ